MSFIKSYWWVFALLIGAFLIYWFMFRTPAKTTTTPTPKPKANPACPLSVEEWEVEVTKEIAKITADQAWLAAVTAQVNTTIPELSTLAKAKRANAIFNLESTGICNPTKPPVA